jgi:peptidoglycan/LPS O-acetylase OafA/YrhL
MQGHDTNLDFIRAFAVLVVVGAHLGWFLGDLRLGFFEISLLGRLGVVIFFAHSGIVNLLSIERHVQKNGEQHLFRAFMTKRCFRIYPLSIFVVAVVYLSHIPVAHIDKWSSTGANHPKAEVIPSLLLVQNFFRFDQLLEPLWSLPFEIQMYCLFPLIYILLRELRSAKALIFLWAALATTEFVIGPHLAKHEGIGQVLTIPDMLYFFMWFLAGIFAYKEMQTAKKSLPFWMLAGLIAFSCIACSLSYDRNKFMLISLCFGLAIPYFKNCENGMVNGICAWVAKYSYGIYLLHDPAIWLGFVRFGHFPMAVRIVVFLSTTVGGSVLVYHALEHPMILIGNRVGAAISRGRHEAVKVRAAVAAAGATL